uniref:Secreted protein n=1 Tax=Anguilla anguilla TaxID=7936 RepID=A0A0E9XJX1_ANGAN
MALQLTCFWCWIFTVFLHRCTCSLLALGVTLSAYAQFLGSVVIAVQLKLNCMALMNGRNMHLFTVLWGIYYTGRISVFCEPQRSNLGIQK